MPPSGPHVDGASPPPGAIATSTLWQVGSQAAMAVLSIITVKLVATGLSTELAGHYNSSYGYLQLFGILADFGLYAVAVREVSRSSDRERTLGALIVLRAIILSLSLAASLAIVWTNPAWRATPFPLAVTLAAAVPFFTLLAGILRTVFQVSYRMHFVFVAEVTQRIVTVAIIAFLVLRGGGESTDLHDLYHFLLAGGLGAFVLFLLSITYASRLIHIRPTWDRALLKTLFLHAAPYGLAFLCTALYRQLDVTLIALLRPDFALQNAYYGFAQRATDMAFIIPTFLLNSTLPILSERRERGEDVSGLLGKTLLVLLIVSGTTAIAAAVWARPLMQLLTTEQYLSAAGTPGADTALLLLSPAMLLNSLILFAFYTLLSHHAWKPLVATLASGALLSFILNVLLIPRYGFIGAGMTSIAVHLWIALLLFPQAQRRLPAHFPSAHMVKLFAFALPVVLFLLLLRPLLTTIPLTIGGMVLLGIVIAAAGTLTGLLNVLRR